MDTLWMKNVAAGCLFICLSQLFFNALMAGTTNLDFIDIDNARICCTCIGVVIILSKGKYNTWLKMACISFCVLFGILILYPFYPLGFIPIALDLLAGLRYAYCFIFIALIFYLCINYEKN